MDGTIQTSQQKRGEHHLPEGKGNGSTKSTIPVNGGGKGSFTSTSQQNRNEYSKNEG
jgi:hypothetical protein